MLLQVCQLLPLLLGPLMAVLLHAAAGTSTRIDGSQQQGLTAAGDKLAALLRAVGEGLVGDGLQQEVAAAHGTLDLVLPLQHQAQALLEGVCMADDIRLAVRRQAMCSKLLQYYVGCCCWTRACMLAD